MLLSSIIGEETKEEEEKFDAQFRALVFAADPSLYESVFIETDSPIEDNIDWIIPSSEEEINEIMSMIREDLNDTQDNELVQKAPLRSNI